MTKAYIIRLSNHNLSTRLAKQSYQAAQDLGYDVEYFEGIQNKSDISKQFLRNNLVASPDGGDIQSNWGTMGCFISHFLLWHKCVELNEPIVILEHDGLPIRDCSPIIDDVEHVCHLDRYLPLSTNYDAEKHFQAYDNNVQKSFDPLVGPYHYSGCFYGQSSTTGSFFRGAYGYVITPEGARRVIDFVRTYGAFPTDMCLCERAINIQGTNGTYVRLNPFFRNVDLQRQYTTRI